MSAAGNERDWRALAERVEPFYPRELIADFEAGDPASSVAWRVNGEVAILLGWGRAILLQLAHPKVAAGVAEHSNFREGRLSRLRRMRRTLDAMLSLTFGSVDEAIAVARRIDRIHGYVHGALPESRGGFDAGDAYSARDPALLRWVHATVLDSWMRTYELFVAPLTVEERDHFCAESQGIGPLLGVPPGYLPTTSAELRGYMQSMLASGEIEVGDTARMLARHLLAPPLPLVGGPLGELLQLPIVGLLPEPIRSAYGLPWDDRRETILLVASTASRVLHHRLPERMHRWPVAVRAARGTAYPRRRRGEP